MLRALLYAYILGGLTFVPLLVAAVVFITIYTSVPIGDPDVTKKTRKRLENAPQDEDSESTATSKNDAPLETNDVPKTRKGWLTVRRTFEESVGDGSYVTLVRSFLDSRSKDPKRSRPKDMWYAALKGKVLYLYEDEQMSECEAAIELSGHQVVVYPEGLPDAELFAKRNAICLKPRVSSPDHPASITKEMKMQREDTAGSVDSQDQKKRGAAQEEKKVADTARDEAFDTSMPWFIFVRSNVEMEDWYMALVHASEQPAQTPTLAPLRSIFNPADMHYLVTTLDDQPDIIPMRWLNALLGRIFYSHYRTHNLEAYIIGRLMKKLAKVKRPAFLTEIAVTEVSVGNRAPVLSKPMLKELTKEGDASLEVHLFYKGEIRITVEATVVINLGARFKPYSVQIVLAVVLKELEGNLLVKVKRPPSNRIWYAFTQTPRMVLEVEPIVSERQITWGMILSTIESKIKEIIQESVVLPNMDDIAFFETLDYEHRGGIWAETRRKPHKQPVGNPPVDDAQSVASAPVPQTNSLPEATPLPSFKSAVNVPAPAAIVISTSVEKEEAVKEKESSTATRRKSWFSSGSAEEFTAALSSTSSQGESTEDRGRTLGAEGVKSSRASTGKSSSSRSTSSSVPSSASDAETPQLSSTVPRSSSRTSTSRHSVVLDSSGSHSGDPRSGSRPTTPRRPSDASSKQRSPSPPGFFSTLKSKAADKQALSNTAKEAMRKWGVNWGGFKTETPPPVPDSTAPSITSSREEASFLQKAKASYAEVRAAVNERIEKEREPPAAPEKPESIADKLAQRFRTSLPNGSASSSEGFTPAVPIVPSSRLQTLSTKKSTPSISIVKADLDDFEETVKPIQAQPTARTMSIPGIHASHRGESMAIGYTPPAPSPVPAPSTSPGESMLKNPAIQSVYRLWKNPGGGNSSDSPVSNPTVERPAVVQAVGGQDEGGLGSSPAPPKLGVSASASPPRVVSATVTKPTPPALPPRSSPSIISPPSSDGSTVDDSSSTTPAAQALRTIMMDLEQKPKDLGDDQGQSRPSLDVVEGRKSDSNEPKEVEPLPADLETTTFDGGFLPEDGRSLAQIPPPLPPRRTPTAV